VDLRGGEDTDDDDRVEEQPEPSPPLARGEHRAGGDEQEADRTEGLQEAEPVGPGHVEIAFRPLLPDEVVVRDLGLRAVRGLAEVEERVRRAHGERDERGAGGEGQPREAEAGSGQPVREIRGNEENAGVLHRRGRAQREAREDVAAGVRSQPNEGQEGQQHERLEGDVGTDHVRGEHLHRRDRDEQRGGQARAPAREARPQHVRETHARDAEQRHHRPRGQIRARAEVGRVEEREDRREEIEEETRVLVEAVVEVARREHAGHVLDEPALVQVGTVAQAPAQAREAERGRQHEDQDEEDPRAGAVHRGGAIIPSAMKLLTVVALAGVIGGHAAPSSAATPAQDLVRRLEQRQRSVGDLTARFVQTYRSGLIGREIVERGVVSIKQPGRMRWEYREPEKKTFVSDGRTFYFYVPADRQVIVRDQAGDRSVPALLLSGQGHLLEQFEAGMEIGPPGLTRLRLVPRKPDPEIQKVFVDVDDETRIRAIHVFDAQGNLSRFDFADMRENVGLKDRLFRFEIPRGVEVVTG